MKTALQISRDARAKNLHAVYLRDAGWKLREIGEFFGCSKERARERIAFGRRIRKKELEMSGSMDRALQLARAAKLI